MNERELFVTALEIDDPVARQVHLQSACGDDADLLHRVELLLASHEQQSRFLETPVVEQLEQPEPGTSATIMSGAGSQQEKWPDMLDKTNAGEDRTTHNPSQPAHEIPLGLLQPSTRGDSLGRLGHYEILEILGRGAFGTVFRAFDDKLQRVVAIKVMAIELAATSPARKRFLREAQASAAIRHENVVRVYGVEESPIPYLVMEYIPGQTLQQRLDQAGPLAIPDVLRLGRQIAEGLAAAHAQDLIHRDIKPGNILLEKGDLERVKITDFGLARAADDASQTQSGMIAGTPMYMAPEQASGHKLDQRADLFSFGSVLYQMLSGRPPFRAATMLAVLKRVVDDSPRPIDEIIPETPAWLCAVVSKLHAKNPDERYQSAREIADVLGHCEAQLKTYGGIKDFSVIPRQRAIPQRSSAWKWIVAALALLVVLPLLALGLVVFTYLATASTANPNIGLNSVPTTIISGSPAGVAQTGWHDWPADAPKPAIAPFDATQAKQHQEEWAAYLKLPVEYTNTIGMKFVLIPPGEFTMGSSPQEIEAASIIAGADPRWNAHIRSEGPQRRVSVTAPFYLGVHEVTQSQFASVMKENPSLFSTIGPHTANDLGIDTGDFPVEALTWHDATSFCRTLQENERLSPLPAYSLPTETQWEFACRAGTTTQFWPGDKDEDLLQIAWFNANGDSRPHAVAGFHANPFGLFDMHGNVWEWIADEWVPPADSPASIPAGQRVLRGGDWSAQPNSCRSSHRHADLPTARYGSIGFRAVLTVDAVQQTLASKTNP
jgi:serine/threonine protein kinase/formylglycine-generating enzyme required for sulfatase activity